MASSLNLFAAHTVIAQCDTFDRLPSIEGVAVVLPPTTHELQTTCLLQVLNSGHGVPVHHSPFRNFQETWSQVGHDQVPQEAGFRGQTKRGLVTVVRVTAARLILL